MDILKTNEQIILPIRAFIKKSGKTNEKKTIKKDIEKSIKRILTHITSNNDLRDYSDDFDEILGSIGSDFTVGDFIGEEKAYWGIGERNEN